MPPGHSQLVTHILPPHRSPRAPPRMTRLPPCPPCPPPVCEPTRMHQSMVRQLPVPVSRPPPLLAHLTCHRLPTTLIRRHITCTSPSRHLSRPPLCSRPPCPSPASPASRCRIHHLSVDHLTRPARPRPPRQRHAALNHSLQPHSHPTLTARRRRIHPPRWLRCRTQPFRAVLGVPVSRVLPWLMGEKGSFVIALILL